MTQPSPEEPVRLESLYPDETVISFGELDVSLGWYKRQEAKRCTPENEADRFDIDKRNRYLAKILNASGALLPEHLHYLPEDKS